MGEVVYKGVRYPGRHAPLIDPVTWQRVQDVLTSHAVGEKQRDHPHYLKSSVFCGGCGNRLIVTIPKNRYGRIYPYFVCVGRHQKYTDCQRQAVLISRVEELVEQEYHAIELSNELRESVESMIRDELASTLKTADLQQREMTTRKQQLLDQRSRLLQAHYAGALPLDLLKEEQDRIARQLADVESRLEATTANLEDVGRNVRTALSYAANCYAAYAGATDHIKRLFNQAFFTKIYVEQDYVRTELAEPFKSLLGAVTTASDEREDVRNPADAVSIEEDEQVGADGIALMDAIRQSRRAPHTSFVQVEGDKNNKPAAGAAGLKETTLVPSAGFEPATPALGERCSIP